MIASHIKTSNYFAHKEIYSSASSSPKNKVHHFAKVKGYPAWPARVSQPTDAKGLKYNVFFYGTYETAVVPRDSIWIYNQATKEKHGKQKRKG